MDIRRISTWIFQRQEPALVCDKEASVTGASGPVERKKSESKDEPGAAQEDLVGSSKDVGWNLTLLQQEAVAEL